MFINSVRLCCLTQANLSPIKPGRFIEPTGLAHPDELLGQLSQPHWQTSLNIRAVLCVLSGTQWAQDKYRSHDGYIAHVRHADVVVCNRTDEIDIDALTAWVSTINPHAKIILTGTPDELQALLDLAHHSTTPARTVALTAPHQHTNNKTDEPISLPYRYHESIGEHHVGGWRLPSDWQFDSYELQKWLLSRPDYLRIKGIIHTTEGWLMLNIAPDGISISDTDERADSRLEMIFGQMVDDAVWQAWDGTLMGMRQST